MKHLKIYEVRNTYIQDPNLYIWIKEWLNNVFGDYTLAGSITSKDGYAKITIFYDGSTWSGISPNKIEEILNFSKYLFDKNIITEQKQFKLQAHGQFLIVVSIDENVLMENPELKIYREAKKYNL